MLALFKKSPKEDKCKTVEDDSLEAVETIAPAPVDEDTMKKNIAEKLQNYRPVARPADFTGPKFYK